MNAADEPTAGADRCRLVAWDGFSFPVPGDWNLAGYAFHREFATLSLEDDAAVRLEMEWTRARRAPGEERIRRRFAAAARALAAAGAESREVPDLPAGWSAFLYSLPDNRRLLAAFRMAPGSDLFCLCRLHFESASRREPVRLARALAAGFREHAGPRVPWAVYDAHFSLRRTWRLEATAFQAGRLLFVFEWRLRRLHLWFFSLADLLLREQSLAAWCADFLNAGRDFPAAFFSAAGPETLAVRRRRRYPLGEAGELARLCFRYQTRCRRLVPQNQVVLWVCQHRRASDLDALGLACDP